MPTILSGESLPIEIIGGDATQSILLVKNLNGDIVLEVKGDGTGTSPGGGGGGIPIIPTLGIFFDGDSTIIAGKDNSYAALQTLPNGYGDGDGVVVAGPDNGGEIKLFTNSAVVQHSWKLKPDGGLQLPSGSSVYTGAASPVGVVIPNHIGDIFIDASTGAIYISVGLTNDAWIVIGGGAASLGDTSGIATLDGNTIYLVGGSQGFLLTDMAAAIGSGNGVLWEAYHGDEAQVLTIRTGVGSAKQWKFKPDGTSTAPGIAENKGIKTSAITSGALPTINLVSGVAAQIFVTRDVFLTVPITFNPTGILTSTLKVEISPDDVTYSTLVTKTLPALAALAGLIDEVEMQVPAGWYVKLTATNAVIGTGTYY